MLKRILGPLVLATLIATSAAMAQATPVKVKDPISNGRTLSEWILDLKALAPQSRNAAAYEIAGMGPEAVRAVPETVHQVAQAGVSGAVPGRRVYETVGDGPVHRLDR